MVRNPSEMQRIHEENVEQRNKEYRKMQDSRNNLSGQPALLKHEYECVKNAIKFGKASKGAKAVLLARLRRLEKRLGIDGANYNSSEF